MSKTVKIILIVCGVLLLLAGTCVGGAVYWFHSKTGDLQAMGEEIRGEGERFGAGTEQQGCLDEALRRAASGGFMDEVRNGLFLQFCLEAAAPTEGFCEGVPAEASIVKSVRWRLEVCQQPTGVDPQRCSRLVAAWQRACHAKPEGVARQGPG